jgi:hypothetical protein
MGGFGVSEVLQRLTELLLEVIVVAAEIGDGAGMDFFGVLKVCYGDTKLLSEF